MQKKAGYAKLENEPGKRTWKNSKIKSGKNPGEINLVLAYGPGK